MFLVLSLIKYKLIGWNSVRLILNLSQRYWYCAPKDRARNWKNTWSEYAIFFPLLNIISRMGSFWNKKSLAFRYKRQLPAPALSVFSFRFPSAIFVKPNFFFVDWRRLEPSPAAYSAAACSQLELEGHGPGTRWMAICICFHDSSIKNARA